MFALEDQVKEIGLSDFEASTIAKRLVLADSRVGTIGDLAIRNSVKPMRIAQEALVLRPDDASLRELVRMCEVLILKYGTTRVSAEAVEGDLQKLDKFWRNNDPLGVYQPGDMFYVDDNHPWRDYFPILILVPAALVGLAALIVAWSASLIR